MAFLALAAMGIMCLRKVYVRIFPLLLSVVPPLLDVYIKGWYRSKFSYMLSTWAMAPVRSISKPWIRHFKASARSTLPTHRPIFAPHEGGTIFKLSSLTIKYCRTRTATSWSNQYMARMTDGSAETVTQDPWITISRCVLITCISKSIPASGS